MKILVVADDKDILALNKINHVQDLSKLTGSETKICFLSQEPESEELQKLQEEGFRILSLSSLIKQSLVVSPPKFSDIVSREEAPSSVPTLSHFYQDQVVFVTGGEGFIGSHLVKHLLDLPVKKVVVYGNGENSAHDLIKDYRTNERFQFILGDIRDEEKITSVMKTVSPNIVFHAAAHKHVPILEHNPEEAIKTNIIGTYNTIKASCEAKIQQFVLISTDKAVNSSSTLGASKRIAEKICLSMDSILPEIKFSTVRFGNVFGSTGSVVPTFIGQMAQNLPLTVTDKNMMRYFMSVDEAVELVLLAGTMKEGNLFSLDMGYPISLDTIIQRLFDFAGAKITPKDIQIIGNRGGEKFSEELVHSFEKIIPSPYEKLMILSDESPLWSLEELQHIMQDCSEKAKTGTKEEIMKLFDTYVSRYVSISKK
ncbi:MAG: SDR family NAD(P)-dependent oxidoreductase [Brevinema sp.]